MLKKISKEILKKMKYLNKNSELDWLVKYVETHQNIIDRKNFSGHFTVSGVVWDEKSKKVLLIFHKKLQKFLQPGGHIEVEDKTLWDAAKREVEEETGLVVVENKKFGKNPILLDVHKISENLKKKELEHFHFDFMFIFGVRSSIKINLQLEEVSDFKWVDLDYDFQDKALREMSERLR